MSRYVLGVDPGLSGALALLDPDGRFMWVQDMPAVAGVVSGVLVADMLSGEGHEGYRQAVIENVHAMPEQGVTSTFKFGRSLGVVEGVITANRWPVVYVTPARWKKALGLSADKGASRRRAIELWPEHAHLFERVKDDGRAEAALLAHWWQEANR